MQSMSSAEMLISSSEVNHWNRILLKVCAHAAVPQKELQRGLFLLEIKLLGYFPLLFSDGWPTNSAKDLSLMVLSGHKSKAIICKQFLTFTRAHFSLSEMSQKAKLLV